MTVCKDRTVSATLTRQVVLDGRRIRRIHNVHKIVYSTALVRRVRDNFHMRKDVHENVGEDAKLPNAAKARALPLCKFSSPLTSRANLCFSPVIHCVRVQLKWGHSILQFSWSICRPTVMRDNHNNPSEPTIRTKQPRLFAFHYQTSSYSYRFIRIDD